VTNNLPSDQDCFLMGSDLNSIPHYTIGSIRLSIVTRILFQCRISLNLVVRDRPQ
jgi:hypothetical protein